MAPKRNRIIHDHWLPSDEIDVAFKINRQLKTVVDETGVVKQHFYDAAESLSVSDISNFNHEVLSVAFALKCASRDLRTVAREGLNVERLFLLRVNLSFVSLSKRQMTAKKRK